MRAFANDSQEIITAASPKLEEELDIGSRLLNFAKSLYNAALGKVSKTFSIKESSFFKLDRSKSAVAADELKENVDKAFKPSAGG